LSLAEDLVDPKQLFVMLFSIVSVGLIFFFGSRAESDPQQLEKINFIFSFFAFAYLLLGLALYYSGISSFMRKRLIENIPTSKVRSIAIGPVEIYGEVVANRKKILISPDWKKVCVYYLNIEKGEIKEGSALEKLAKTKIRTDRIPFLLRDETGEVLVDTKEAEIKIFTHEVTTNTDYIIAPGDKIYIMGTASKNPQADKIKATETEKIVINKGENKQVFTISNKSEKEILTKLKRGAIAGFVGGITLTIFFFSWVLFSLV